MMGHHRETGFAKFAQRSVVVLLLLAARVAFAQDVATVAEIEGAAEIGHGGTWRVATIGATVQLGDELRTGRPGRMRVVFQDDTPINLGDDTDLVVDEQVFNPSQSTYRSVIRLLKGKIRALVSDYYQQPRAKYVIETATAVSGVRGTEFVVAYDDVAELTEVVGITGRVEVHSVLDRARHGVFVTERELTSVARGQLPTPPRQLDDATFRQYLHGLEFIGSGAAESLTVGHPILTGKAIPLPDRPDAFVNRPGPGPAGSLSRRERSREADTIDQPESILQAIKDNRGNLGINLGGGGSRR